MHFETKMVHGGEKNSHFQDAVTVPIFQSANYITANATNYHDIKYIRLNNTPNHEVLHDKLCQLEEGEAALVTGSGMGAISTLLMTVLRPGDHLLAAECLYGGTLTLIQKDLKELEISVSYINVENPESWASLLKPNTKGIYVESIANPLTTVGELDAVARFAKQHGLVSMIDNTIASPYFFQPLKLGFDLSAHSATKYLNGHSDIVAGAIIGSKTWIEKIKNKLDHFGATLDPHACFLLNRGMKTLALRMKQSQENALQVARFLEKHSKVKAVHYPGLESHPNHKTAKKLFSGFSGLLSFELEGSVADAEQFMKKLHIPLIAPSLGGVETLITRPCTTSHFGLTPEERKQIGISDTLIRVSCGIENTEDLLADFEQAL